jgi:DNA modification methylase
MTDDNNSLIRGVSVVEEAEAPPDALHVDGENPNEQSDETFGLLVDSIRDGAWLGGPIIVNRGTLPGYDDDGDGLICDGEHRWRAAQEADRDTVPVKFCEFRHDAVRRYYRLHLNKVSGEHDTKRDALEYDHLLKEGHSDEVEALTDAAGEDLDDLLAELRVDSGVGPEYEYDPDHNVYFEDCVEGMRERLADDSVDMAFTSPPYNIEKTQRSDERANPDVIPYTDNRTPEEFREWLTTVFSEVSRVLKPSGHLFINLDHRIIDGQVSQSDWIINCVPLPWRSYIVWDKKGITDFEANNLGRFYTNWEPVYHFSKDPGGLNGTRNHGVWSIVPVSGKERGVTEPHPAPYPVELVDRAIEATTSEGDTVLDPFMGSGTTAVAAIQNDREYVGFELDEEGAYKPIIERRIGEAKRQREASVNSDNE